MIRLLTSSLTNFITNFSLVSLMFSNSPSKFSHSGFGTDMCSAKLLFPRCLCGWLLYLLQTFAEMSPSIKLTPLNLFKTVTHNTSSHITNALHCALFTLLPPPRYEYCTLYLLCLLLPRQTVRSDDSVLCFVHHF